MPNPPTCRSCGRKIIWANGPNGPIPMDARPMIAYRLVRMEGDSSRDPQAIRFLVTPGADEKLDAIADLLRNGGPPGTGGGLSGTALVEAIAEVFERPSPNVPLYVSHFQTCPNAAEHSRR